MTTATDYATPLSALFAEAGDRLRSERALQLENENTALEASNAMLRGRVEELEQTERGLRAALGECLEALTVAMRPVRKDRKAIDLRINGSGV